MSNTSDIQWEDEQPLTAAPTPTSDVQWEDEVPGNTAAQNTAAGQVKNDVGNVVTVPQDGEAFADTIARAVAQGKKTTQADINREVSTMPKKVAAVLGAAPVIGAAGAAAGAATASGPAAVEFLEAAAKAHPFVAHLIAKGIEGLGIGGGLVAVKKLLQ
jgi:hypothetical protein